MASYMRLSFFILAGALALSACTTVSPEARVRADLIAAGVQPKVAGCMADRMVAKLSLGQLKRLQSLAGLKSKPVNEMSMDELLHRLRALNDPQIVAVVLRAGIGCSIAG
jgi:predicted GNAT family acetyltransferase